MGLDEKGKFANPHKAVFMAFVTSVAFSGLVDLATFFGSGVPQDFSYVTTFFIPFSGWYLYKPDGPMQAHGHMDIEQGVRRARFLTSNVMSRFVRCQFTRA